MRNLLKIAGASAIVLASALAAAAHVDVPKMTCADFAAMDLPAKLNASTDVLAWIDDAANAKAADGLIAKYTTHADNNAKWKPEELQTEIEGHCKGADAAATVVSRLLEHT